MHLESIINQQFWLFYAVLAARYIVIAGIAFVVFYVLVPHKFTKRKIQALSPKRKEYLREVGYSFLTFVIFALIGVVLSSDGLQPYTKIYNNVSDYGWVYFG